MKPSSKWVLGLLLFAFTLVGCSDGKGKSAKETLTDDEKKQIEQLNQQRADEWGTQNPQKK